MEVIVFYAEIGGKLLRLALIVLACWVLLAVPAALLTARLLAGEDYPPVEDDE